MKQMRKRCIYLCRRIKVGEDGYREGFDFYRAPIKKWISVRPVSGEAVLAAGGEFSKGSLIVKIPIAQNDFSENDRCYIYTSPSNEYDKMCKSADYRVVGITLTQSFAEIILERAVKDARI